MRLAAGLTLLALTFVSALQSSALAQPTRNTKTGSVIFIHPDGTGLNTWSAARYRFVGPDGLLNYDRLPNMGIYIGAVRDALTPSSNAGATAHAYGVIPMRGAFGFEDGAPMRAASGQRLSLMMEAKRKGLAVGVVNSAGVGDAGTGVFLAQVDNRRMYAEIARQMLARQPDVALGGGETWFLPKGVKGRHGEGSRTDGRNLIAEARKQGYTVVFTRDELLKVAPGTKRLLGLFAAEDTFNDKNEETLRAEGLPLYVPTAPTIGEMTKAALRVFDAIGKPFFLVAEEEATDNFGGENNAKGVFEAIRRADEALGIAIDYQKRRPNTLVITCADSDCGGLQVKGEAASEVDGDDPAPERDPDNGSPIDGMTGTKSVPFLSGPDKLGKHHLFYVQWAGGGDLSGGSLVRAIGLNANLVRGNVRNTDVYRIMFQTLFGRPPQKLR